MFPFKWDMTNRGDLSFSEKTNIRGFKPSPHSEWENIPLPKNETYKRELYNEKSFFYPFTHQVLYDEDTKDGIIQHYERKETYEREVTYKIHVLAAKEDCYSLKLRSIGMNLYATGVGVLIFYLENYLYPGFEDILRINQFGRRIFPPFIDVEKGIAGTKEAELADFIAIEGLRGNPLNYYEDFSFSNEDKFFRPAKFIAQLIRDFSAEIVPKPVIDDRMFVMCWYGNDSLANQIENDYEKFKNGNDWYRFLFVDGSWATCQNEEMKKELLAKHTYQRWQQYGSLYGCTRYSTVFISSNSDFAINVLLRTFRTMYARIAELSFIQRASILKFSEEVTSISKLEKKKTNKLVLSISDLYRQYIQFNNKIYFSEITAQEQGIEIYKMLHDAMGIKTQVKELDGQIEELHRYVSILEDKVRNTNIELLTIISSVIIIPTLIIAFAEMHEKRYWMPPVFMALAGLTIFSIRNSKLEEHKVKMIYVVFLFVFLLLLICLII